MIALLLSAAIASPTLLLPSPWESQPGKGVGQYARYVRQEQDGTNSELSAIRQACNTCQPGFMAQYLYNGYARIASITASHTIGQICGREAHHVLAVGVTAWDPRERNIEAFFFKDGATLYTLSYTFQTAAPMPDAEVALEALCPPSS